jgi:hypothetical protein
MSGTPEGRAPGVLSIDLLCGGFLLVMLALLLASAMAFCVNGWEFRQRKERARKILQEVLSDPDYETDTDEFIVEKISRPVGSIPDLSEMEIRVTSRRGRLLWRAMLYEKI